MFPPPTDTTTHDTHDTLAIPYEKRHAPRTAKRILQRHTHRTLSSIAATTSPTTSVLHHHQHNLTMVNPPPTPQDAQIPLTPPTDCPLQLPIPPRRHPPLHLHLHLRPLRLPQHNRQPQGKLLCGSPLEVRPHRRAPESVRQFGVLCYGGEWISLRGVVREMGGLWANLLRVGA
jgi:hypothetical protein